MSFYYVVMLFSLSVNEDTMAASYRHWSGHDVVNRLDVAQP